MTDYHAASIYANITSYVVIRPPSFLDILDYVQDHGAPPVTEYSSWVPKWSEISLYVLPLLKYYFNVQLHILSPREILPPRTESKLLSVEGFPTAKCTKDGTQSQRRAIRRLSQVFESRRFPFSSHATQVCYIEWRAFWIYRDSHGKAQDVHIRPIPFSQIRGAFACRG